ncbi:MAG: glutamate synthase central domain-containing protein, partial [Gemmataceae bacterium]
MKAVPPLKRLEKAGLYDPALERDACGVGVVANINGSKSHEIVAQAVQILVRLGHRGACGCDPETGDGAGILLQLPHAFFEKEARRLGFALPAAGRYGVGVAFLPRDRAARSWAEEAIRVGLDEEGLSLLGWRDVPVVPEAIGPLARDAMPVIRHYFAGAPNNFDGDALERKLYLARKESERLIREHTADGAGLDFTDFYVVSCSSRTLIYKGLLKSEQLGDFYPDLSDESVESAFGLVHSRFSTNTLGEWKLSHPYRYIAHNGEINTVRGNRNWMTARERSMTSDLFGKEVSKLAPVCAPGQSDSASFDNVFELMVMSGREVEHVAAMMIPEAWYGHEAMPQAWKDFYEYHGGLMEPWDGPALIAFTDGRKIGAVLDRNGLRPFRYTITRDGLLVMASESGVLEIEPHRIEMRRRLRPGQMFLLDLEEGRIIGNEEIKGRLSSRRPYGEWLRRNRVPLDILVPHDAPAESAAIARYDAATLTVHQQVFGYTQEDVNLLIEPMAREAGEPTGSMGNDAALAVLSDRPQSTFSYFKQLFAQVSNPPLDYVREALVTQLSVPVGTRRNVFDETPEHARLLRIDHPILLNDELETIKGLQLPGLVSRT